MTCLYFDTYPRNVSLELITKNRSFEIFFYRAIYIKTTALLDCINVRTNALLCSTKIFNTYRSV